MAIFWFSTNLLDKQGTSIQLYQISYFVLKDWTTVLVSIAIIIGYVISMLSYKIFWIFFIYVAKVSVLTFFILLRGGLTVSKLMQE